MGQEQNHFCGPQAASKTKCFCYRTETLANAPTSLSFALLAAVLTLTSEVLAHH